MYKFKTEEAYVSILCFSLCSLFCRVFHNAFNKLSLIWAVWMQWTPKVKILCKIHNLAQNKQGGQSFIFPMSCHPSNLAKPIWTQWILKFCMFIIVNVILISQFLQKWYKWSICLAQLLKIYLNHLYIMHLQNPDVYCCAIFLSNISCSNLAKGEFTELLSITHQNMMPSHTVH